MDKRRHKLDKEKYDMTDKEIRNMEKMSEKTDQMSSVDKLKTIIKMVPKVCTN